MRLDPRDVEAIAGRVAELIGTRPAAPTAVRFVDAAEVARAVGVERDWVYAHARERAPSGSAARRAACASTCAR